MQHKPYGLCLVQAHFDEMVAGPECTEMVRVIAAIELRMLCQDGVITSFEFVLPDALVTLRNVMPGAAVACAAVIGTSVGHGRLDGRANTLQIIREIARIETRL